MTHTRSPVQIDSDLHVHTYLSSCCHDKERQRPAAIFSLAEEMGVRTIGFSDHIWANPDIPPSDWYRSQGPGQVAQLRADLACVSSPVRALVGCEAETIALGKFGITRAFAEELDYVLLSCSHFHMEGFVESPASRAPSDVARHMVAFFRSGAASGLPTAIAHPMLPLGYWEVFDAALACLGDAELMDAFGIARDHHVAIEVTLAYLNPRFSIETPIRLLSLAKTVGCLFTLGSDAHSPDAQRHLPELERLITEVGLAQDDLLPLADVARNH